MFVYLVDMDSSTYISWNYLLVHFKVNKQNSTLQLLSTIQILEMFGSSHLFIDDIQPKLELLKLIYDIIKAEEEYQIGICNSCDILLRNGHFPVNILQRDLTCFFCEEVPSKVFHIYD